MDVKIVLISSSDLPLRPISAEVNHINKEKKKFTNYEQ
jgi:hypothetical protein